MTTSVRDYLTIPKLGLVRSVRSGQIAMAEEVEDIIENGGIAFEEAGTGTGKSFAYGLPAILSDRRVVISTGKKALQEQLVARDLPHLAKTVRGAVFSLLKGKGNYFCSLRNEEFRGTSFFSTLNTQDVARFDTWLQSEEDSNGLADLSGWNYPWIHNVRVSECVKKYCPHAEGCGYIKSREKANAARILVVNHALLAHDLALGGGKILGPYDVLIIDEAHEAPKFFRDAFSLTLHPRQPDQIARMLKDSDFELGENFTRIYKSLFAAFPSRPDVLQLNGNLLAHFGELYAQVARVHTAMIGRGLLSDEGEANISSASEMARVRAKLRSGGMMLGKVRALCEIVLNLNTPSPSGDDEDAVPAAPPQEWVKYTERRQDDEMQLIVTPLEVGPLVAPSLLAIKSVIVTSATLATANGMAYMANEYGLSESQIRIKAVHPSPFDYQNNSALYISSTSPDPTTRNEAYFKEMCAETHELLTASMGGAFVLCAATADMEAIHEGIYRMTMGKMNYRLGMQTNASPEATVRWFLENPTSVLVGLKTYWAGIDIPGDALRLVVIPRLPFPNEGDAVLRARKRAFQDRIMEANSEMKENEASIRSWEAFSLQEAIMDLKQGGGRLIRAENDRGIVAILDKRAYKSTKKYSRKIRGALPHPETYDKNMVLEVLRAFGSQAVVRKK